MKLSLSVRVAEKFLSKRQANMSLADLADLAAANRYHALCMRASQLGTQTPLDIVRQKAGTLDAQALKVSMVTGDFPIPENTDDEGPLALRNITPYLDLAEALGADLLRIAMKTEEDIEWAQRAIVSVVYVADGRLRSNRLPGRRRCCFLWHRQGHR